MKTTKAEQNKIVALAEAWINRHFPQASESPGACFYYAVAACIAASELNRRFLIQGGSAFWPCVSSELDDGEGPNRFGYEWSDDAAAMVMVDVNTLRLPEMHCWAVDPERSEIIDLASRFWPAQAARLGIKWRAPHPPRAFWTSFNGLPMGVDYRATRGGTLLAIQLVAQLG